VGEAPEPVRAAGEWDRLATEPVIAGVAIGGEELAIAEQRFDARPRADGRNLWPQLPPRLASRRGGAPGLSEDRASTEDAGAGGPALGGDGGFHGGDLVLELGPEQRGLAELGWEHERQGDGLGHRAVEAKELPGAGGVERALAEQGGEAVHAGPLVNAFDQPILDRVGRRIDQLAQDVGGVDEADDAHLLGGPQVLPAAPEGVLALREQLVEMFGERGEGAVAIEEDGVVVLCAAVGYVQFLV
jgi:hypothetical protein